MFPYDILSMCGEQIISIDLKNGTNISGTMVVSDHLMNIRLKDATLTSKDGLQFWKMDEVFTKGSEIQAVRLPESIFDEAQQIVKSQEAQYANYMKSKTFSRTPRQQR